MNRLNKKYIAILLKDRNPSENFQELENRIKKDKHSSGVLITCISRNEMFNILYDLFKEKVITEDDLVDFSEELRSSLIKNNK